MSPSLVLRVTITPTADGQGEYIQVMSEDQLTVNVVLVAHRINLIDTRGAPPRRPRAGR